MEDASKSRLPRTPVDARDRESARRALRELRAAIPPAARSLADQAIAAAVEAIASQLGARCVGAYWPLAGEPDLRASLERWHAAGVTVALPRVAARDAALAFDRWVPGCALADGAHGTRHPAVADTVSPDLVVVPCVGFDRDNHRLGYGGGYYDRTLAANPVTSVGVAYDLLEVSSFGAQPHDRALDWIVTESRRLPRGRPPR